MKFLLALWVGWIAVSYLLDGRRGWRAKILLDMKDEYSRKEVLDLVYRMKAEAMWFYLFHGLVLGLLLFRVLWFHP